MEDKQINYSLGLTFSLKENPNYRLKVDLHPLPIDRYIQRGDILIFPNIGETKIVRAEVASIEHKLDDYAGNRESSLIHASGTIPFVEFKSLCEFMIILKCGIRDDSLKYPEDRAPWANVYNARIENLMSEPISQDNPIEIGNLLLIPNFVYTGISRLKPVIFEGKYEFKPVGKPVDYRLIKKDVSSTIEKYLELEKRLEELKKVKE